MPSAAQKKRNKKNRIAQQRKEQTVDLINEKSQKEKESERISKISEFVFDESKLNEPVLGDDYPVNWDYFYLINGKIFRSDVKGTVSNLRRNYFDVMKVKAEEVKRYDIGGRREQLNKAGLID